MTPPEDKFENLLRWPLADGRWVFATAKETRVLSVRPGDNSPSPAVLGKHLPLTTTVDQIEQLLDGVIGAYLPDRYACCQPLYAKRDLRRARRLF